jgi:hypothetical protein
MLQVKTIPDRFSGLMGYLEAFRLPLLEEMREEMSANLVDALSSSRHFPIDAVRSLPVRKDKSGAQASPSMYRLTVARGRRGARNFPCTGDVVLRRAGGRPTSRATAAHAVSRTSGMSTTVRWPWRWWRLRDLSKPRCVTRLVSV